MPDAAFEVACYTFPHYHRSALSDALYVPGWSEYELARGARPQFSGHHQPRTPLLGELDEAEPGTWDAYADVAVGAGLDVLIWDAYWYDGRPALHEALEQGFLRARDERLRFAVMWTNHPWVRWFPLAGVEPPPDAWRVLTQGGGVREQVFPGPDEDRDEIRRSVGYLISRYLHHPRYWRIDGKPVLVLWDVDRLVGLHGMDGAAEIVAEIRQLGRALGHDELHLHTPNGNSRSPERLADVGIDSFGLYNAVSPAAAERPPEDELPDYGVAAADVEQRMWPAMADASPLPFFPSITPGWDNTPRCLDRERGEQPDRERWPGGTSIVVGQSPAAFEAHARAAVRFLQERGTRPAVITVGCFNEWTEGQYLLPDTRHGYGMSRALARGLGRLSPPGSDAVAEPPAPVELPTTRVTPFDPPPELGALQAQAPLHPLRYPDGHVGWLVTSHALARAVLVDARFTIRTKRAPVGDPATEAQIEETWETLPEGAGVLIFLDPPRHTRIRRALASFFTVKRVSEYDARLRRIVAGRLDAMEQAGAPADLVEAFALPISSFTICEILGAPHDERAKFERPVATIEDPDASGAEKVAAIRVYSAFCRELIAQKRDAPDDGLLSTLVQEGELSEEEIVGVALQLFSAGHETTSSMLALSTLALLSDRARWDALRAEPERLDAAVEELLRYLTIVQTGAFTRTALEDVELDGGVRIEAGESVTVSLAAANRDPERFADPDALALSRDASGHVAFGHGRHMCIGQHLARLELRIGLEALMARFPGLRLAVPAHELSFVSGKGFLYGVHALPVAW